MGFSAGGQVALELWRTRPGLYGGLIVDAAYPADTVDGKDVVYGPPEDPAIKEVPLLILVGGEDRLLWVWEQVEGPYREAGIPLEVIVVPGLGHDWLFGEAQIVALEDWLGRIPPNRSDQVVAPPQEEPEPAAQP
jgi:pimeloyl-ACP methyl ester carboxylesterase